jgi:hypothetical protein
MAHLIARIEMHEAKMPLIIGIYSKDAIAEISSNFAEAFNFLVQNSSSGRNKWRSHRLNKFMSMFDGTCESLVWVFVCYLFDNADWNRSEISPQYVAEVLSYTFMYLYNCVEYTKKVISFIRNSVPSETNLRTLFFYNIPTFICTHKYKAALYFDSDDKLIPAFLSRLEIYAYGSKMGENNIDLYWPDINLINKLFENSNKFGRKLLSEYFIL